MRGNQLLRKLILTVLLGVISCPALSDQAKLWQHLNSGDHIALLRHAIAPGTGDPLEFKVNDCSTQRNLSDPGRDQAKQIGKRLSNNGISSATVYSSQWCRCLETAELLNLGGVTALDLLNSFFRDVANKEPQTAKLQEWIRSQSIEKPIILVTHQVNITALTGVYPASGELIVVRVSGNAPLEVVGTVQTNL